MHGCHLVSLRWYANVLVCPSCYDSNLVGWKTWFSLVVYKLPWMDGMARLFNRKIPFWARFFHRVRNFDEKIDWLIVLKIVPNPRNDKAHGLINDGLLTQGDYYFKVYTRMQPYVIGLLMGYVFFKTRGKQIKIPHVSADLTSDSEHCRKISHLFKFLYSSRDFLWVAFCGCFQLE